MSHSRFGPALCLVSMLAGCGGGGGSSSSSGGSTSSAPPPPPPSTAGSGCSLAERQNWAAAQLKEWYLFPETLPSSLDPT
ncbi:MAG: peptidase, partial [Alphaproteobacteria bacterium]|nr:peptidase [Alphaproteobacteria bacterium]